MSDQTESRVNIVEGVTVDLLKLLFAMTGAEVRERLGDLPPVGTRRGVNIYRLKSAAQRLIKPDFRNEAEMLSTLMRTRIEELPTKMQKHYWDTQRSMDETLKRRKELWPTDSIVSIVGDAFKTMRLSLLLLPDNLKREGNLTDRQHETLARVIDRALDKLSKDMLDAFENRRDDTLDSEESPEEDGEEADL